MNRKQRTAVRTRFVPVLYGIDRIPQNETGGQHLVHDHCGWSPQDPVRFFRGFREFVQDRMTFGNRLRAGLPEEKRGPVGA